MTKWKNLKNSKQNYWQSYEQKISNTFTFILWGMVFQETKQTINTEIKWLSNSFE